MRLRPRNVVIAASVAVFLALFLSRAGGMPWQPTLLAVGGLSLIGLALMATIGLVEANDLKHAKANLERCRKAEAEDAGRRLKGGLIG